MKPEIESTSGCKKLAAGYLQSTRGLPAAFNLKRWSTLAAHKNAVRVEVAQADEAAVRTTRDVDFPLRREGFAQAQAALAARVAVTFAGERVHPDDTIAIKTGCTCAT